MGRAGLSDGSVGHVWGWTRAFSFLSSMAIKRDETFGEIISSGILLDRGCAGQNRWRDRVMNGLLLDRDITRSIPWYAIVV